MIPESVCADCGRPYGDEHGFPRLYIPDNAWKQIAPNPDGTGKLCPSCMAGRCVRAGIETAALWVSGPFVKPWGSGSVVVEGRERWYRVERLDGVEEGPCLVIPLSQLIGGR